MKIVQWCLVVAGLVLAQCSWASNETLWAKSYQLEAAKRYSESLSVLNQMQAFGSDAELLLLRRGWLYYLAGQYGDSSDWYKRALQNNPKSVDARLGMTLPLLAQQRWREASLYAKQVLEISAFDYTAYLRLIVAEEGMRDWTSMKKHAGELAERYPSDATALVYLARAHAWLGEADDARRVYGAVLSRSTGNLEAQAYVTSSRK